MTAMDKGGIKKALEAERIRLEHVRLAIEGEDGETESQKESLGELSSTDQHPADVGTETFERTKDFGILENVVAELADVEHALRRLALGVYGTCEACGEALPAERLEALPAARFCVRDQVRAERDARAAAGPA